MKVKRPNNHHTRLTNNEDRNGNAIEWQQGSQTHTHTHTHAQTSDDERERNQHRDDGTRQVTKPSERKAGKGIGWWSARTAAQIRQNERPSSRRTNNFYRTFVEGFPSKKKQTNKKQWWVTDWFFSFQACFLVSLALKPVEVLWLVGSYGVSRDWPGTSPTGLDFGRVFFYYYASSLRRWQRVVTHRRFEGGKQRAKSPPKK